MTGALHEDGLADVADGFGGGRDAAAKLEIMRDSRLGTYGAVILLVSFAAKISALAALPDGACRAKPAAAHALSRGVLPCDVDQHALCAQGRPCRQSRPARSARRRRSPRASRLRIALLSLSFANALLAAIAAAASAIGMAWLAQRQIGGQTGDVLGGAEQVAETAILVLLAARLGTP